MTPTPETKKPASYLKVRIAGMMITTLMIVGMASAAGSINFTGITNLVNDVVLIVPAILALVIAMAPLIVTVALVGALVVFLAKIFGYVAW